MFDQLRGEALAGSGLDHDADLAPVFLAPRHRAVIDGVVGCVLQGRKLVAAVGEAGLGKTTLLTAAMDELRRQTFLQDALATAVARPTHLRQLAGGMHDPLSLQRLIGESLGVRHAQLDAPSAFVRSIPAGRGACRLVLLIDDAQDLSAETLQYAALMLGLLRFTLVELQLVLFGRPGPWLAPGNAAGLAGTWPATPDIIPIERLTQAESERYLMQKLRGAYGLPALGFTAGARRALIRHAGGVPRELDAVAERALNRARRQGVRRVDRAMLLAAAQRKPARDIAKTRRSANRAPIFALAAGGMIAGLAIAWLALPHTAPTPATTPATTPAIGMAAPPAPIASLVFPAVNLPAAKPVPIVSPLTIARLTVEVPPPVPGVESPVAPPPDRMLRVSLSYKRGDARAHAVADRAAAALRARGAIVSGPVPAAAARTFGVARYAFAQDRDAAQTIGALLLPVTGTTLRAEPAHTSRLAAPGTVEVAVGAP